MTRLTNEEIKNLNIGDEVVYKERDGQLSGYWYRARIIEKHPFFLELSIAANKDFNDPYENANAYFKTSYAYVDSVEYGGCRLYKES